MPFQSKDSAILGQQLKVQEVCVRFADVGLYTASGNDVTIDLKETIESVPVVLNCDNSAPSAILIAQSAIAVTGSTVVITLGAPFAANDTLIIKYIVSE
jgi:hypothetical protein